MFPSSIAVVKCEAHTKSKDPGSRGNALADHGCKNVNIVWVHNEGYVVSKEQTNKLCTAAQKKLWNTYQHTHRPHVVQKLLD